MTREEAIKGLVDAGLSQRSLAKMIGISEAPISQWVRGKQKMSPLAAKAFDKWFDEFYWKLDEIYQKMGE